MNAKASIVLGCGQQDIELARVLRAVEIFCRQHRVPFYTTCDTQVAVDEMLSNVFKHEQKPVSGQLAEVQLDIADDCLRVRIESYGEFFDSTTAGKPTDLDALPADRASGGLGIFLVRHLMNGISCHREGDKNILLMEKFLKK